jgi:hypothetical protein
MGTLHGVPMAYYLTHVNDETDECILWPYGQNGSGYGVLWFDGRTQKVHILSCVHHHGPRPSGMDATHLPVICHNTLCFNGRHLRWGSARENHADAVRDGTATVYERCGQAKLTWALATEIRERYAAGGVTQAALGIEYGVHNSVINRIVHQQAWV